MGREPGSREVVGRRGRLLNRWKICRILDELADSACAYIVHH